MALPSTIDKATPAATDSPALGDDQIRALKLFIEDVFGIPDATSITAAAFSISAGGVVTVSQGIIQGTDSDDALDFSVADSLLKSATSMVFRIDSDNDDTGRNFHWQHNAGTELMRLVDTGTLTLNDSGVGNANMTVGLTINQGANDDQMFCLKSSDVATVVTTLPLNANLDVETDDYYAMGKFSATLGGTDIISIGEVTAATGLRTEVLVGAPATTSTNSSVGIIAWVASEHDGANALTAATANACLVSIAANTSGGNLTRWLIDTEGDVHQTTDAHTTLDSFPDAEICRSLDLNHSKGGLIRSKWDDFINKDKQVLVDAGLFKSIAQDELLNMTQLARLHNGAIWQLYTQHKELEQRLLALEAPHG